MASYYYGSYGLVRGYGPLCKTLKAADDSVFEDSRRQRREHKGMSDRVVVLVSADTGQCWWAEDEEDKDSRLDPVIASGGQQARYEMEVIRAMEELWNAPKELAGFV